MPYSCVCGKTLKSGNNIRDASIVKHYDTKYHKKHAPVKYEELYKKQFKTDKQEEINKILLENTPLYQDVINVILEYTKEDDLQYHENNIYELEQMIKYICDRRRYNNEYNEPIEDELIIEIHKKKNNHHRRLLEIMRDNQKKIF